MCQVLKLYGIKSLKWRTDAINENIKVKFEWNFIQTAILKQVIIIISKSVEWNLSKLIKKQALRKSNLATQLTIIWL